MAQAHRSGCHRSHSCPSDHATYRWRQPSTEAMLLCVASYADERDSSFRERISYQRRTYWCKPAGVDRRNGYVRRELQGRMPEPERQRL